MTSRDFAFWLQGFFEVTETTDVTTSQVETIKNHLNLVFIHEIDPSMGPPAHQAVLNAAHKPTLQQLIPDQKVIQYDNVSHPKPSDWTSTWEYSTLHGWYDPKYGRLRC